MNHTNNSPFDNEGAICKVLDTTKDLAEETRKVMIRGWRDRMAYWLKYGFGIINPCGRDRFASFLFGKPWKGLLISISVILFAALTPILIAIITGNFENSALDMDARHDYGYWNHILTSLIIVVALSIYFTELSRVLFELCTRRVFLVNKDQFNKFVSMGNRTYSGMLITLIPWILAFIVCISTMFVFHAGKTNAWHSINTTAGAAFAGWTSTPFLFTTYYLVASTLLRIGATFLVLIRFFNFDASIQPLHPDGCGGLYPLGRLSMRLNMIVFGFGVVCALGIWVNTGDYKLSVFHPMNILIAISYVTGSIVIFFLPLYAAHSRMREARTQIIEVINNRFQRLNEDIVADMRQDKSLLIEKIQEIEGIRKMHEIAMSMPVYPFNTKTVSSFVGSIGVPIVLCIAQMLIEKIL